MHYLIICFNDEICYLSINSPEYVPFEISLTFEENIWASLYVLIALLVFVFLLVNLQYLNFMPKSCQVRDDPLYVMVNIVGGITEPIDFQCFNFGAAGATAITLLGPVKLSMSSVS